MVNTTGYIEKYAEINDISKTQAKREIENFVSAFKNITYSEGGVDIRGFLKSEVVDVPAKTARNPKTGELVSLAPKKVVKIKVSSKFKNMMED